MQLKQKIKDNFPAILAMLIGLSLVLVVTVVFVIPQMQYIQYVQTHDTLTATYTGTLSHYEQKNVGSMWHPDTTTLFFTDGKSFWLSGTHNFELGVNYTLTYQTYNNLISSSTEISLEIIK